MRQRVAIFFILCLVLLPSTVFSDNYGKYLGKWLLLLDKGGSAEKRAALDNLWFLKYVKYRLEPRGWDAILRALNDKDPSVRIAAASALKALGADKKREVRAGEWPIECCRNLPIVPALIKALEDRDAGVRAEAAAALGMYYGDGISRYNIDKEERAVAPLIKALKDKDPWVRLNAVYSLGELASRLTWNTDDHLMEMLEVEGDWRDKYVQQEAVIALRKMIKSGGHSLSAGRLLVKKSADPYLKREAIKAFEFYGFAEAKDAILAAAEDKDELTRIAAHRALPDLPFVGAGRKLEILVKSLQDPSPRVRRNAAQVIVALRNPSLSEMAERYDALARSFSADSDIEVRQSAGKSLVYLGDKRGLRVMADSMAAGGQDFLFVEELFSLLAKKTSTGKVYKKMKSTRGSYELLVNPDAVDALTGALNRAGEDSRYVILRLLGGYDDPRVAQAAKKHLNDASAEARKWAASAIERSIGADVTSILISQLKDPDASVRMSAADSLGESAPDKAALSALLEALKDTNQSVRSSALLSLRSFDDPAAAKAAYDLLGDKDGGVRNTAVFFFLKRPNPIAVDRLMPILSAVPEYPLDSTSARAAEALGAIGDRRAVAPLIGALKNGLRKDKNVNKTMDRELRSRAAEALGKINDPKAIPALKEAFLDKDADEYVRYKSGMALVKIDEKVALDSIESFLKDPMEYRKNEFRDIAVKLREKYPKPAR